MADKPIRLSWKDNEKMQGPEAYSMHKRVQELTINNDEVFNFVNTCIMCVMMNASGQGKDYQHLMKFAVPDHLIPVMALKVLIITRKGNKIEIYI